MPETLLARIARYEKHIASCTKLDGTPADPEAIAGLDKTCVFSMEEYMSLQNLKSAAVAAGIMTVEDGNALYNILGEGGPEKVNKSSLGTRLVLTQVLAELLQLRKRKRI